MQGMCVVSPSALSAEKFSESTLSTQTITGSPGSPLDTLIELQSYNTNLLSQYLDRHNYASL